MYRSVEKFIRVPVIRRGSVMALCLSLCSVDRMKKDVSRILLQISIDTGRSIDQNLKNVIFKRTFVKKIRGVRRDEFYKIRL